MMNSDETRQSLVDAIRMLEHSGIVDYNGHCSIRTRNDAFLINSASSNRGTLGMVDLLEVDLDGVAVSGSGRPPMEFHIHSEIYRHRSDVGAIVHAHPRWSTILTLSGHRLKTVYAQAALLRDVPLFESPLSINTRSAAEELADTLGNSRAVLMRAHGAAVVGADITECFALAMYLEENAHRQYLATQLGSILEFTDIEKEICEQNLFHPWLFQKIWHYQHSKLAMRMSS